MLNHYRRWNIQLDEKEEFNRFKNRLLHALDSTVGQFIVEQPSMSNRFCLVLGLRQPAESGTGLASAPRRAREMLAPLGQFFGDTTIYNTMALASNVQELVLSLHLVFWLLSEHDCPYVANIVDAIRGAIDASPLIDIRIARRGKQVTLYPSGAALLDKAVINDILAWLQRHPAAAKHFDRALEIYLKKDTAQYRNLLDELRSALEKLVRRMLGNRKNLENQKELLLQWMEVRGAHVQIRNLFERLLACYTQYHNDAVKHGEGWSEKDVEYMIYQTGVFMRLLLVLNGDDRS